MARIQIAPNVPLKRPATTVDAAFFNQGVIDLMRIAEATADTIATSGKRPLQESFAVAALLELAEQARELLISSGPDADVPSPAGPLGSAPADAVAGVAA